MEYVELKIKTRKKILLIQSSPKNSSIELNSYLIDDFMAQGCCYSDLT